jgi:hypothetical protein
VVDSGTDVGELDTPPEETVTVAEPAPEPTQEPATEAPTAEGETASAEA